MSGDSAREDRSDQALAKAINWHLLREVERSRSHDAEQRAIAQVARVAGVTAEIVHAALNGTAEPEFVEALWNFIDQSDRGQAMMNLSDKDPVVAITTDVDRRDILARAYRAARLAGRRQDGPGFGHPEVLRRVDFGELSPAAAKEAVLLGREAGLSDGEIGVSRGYASKLESMPAMLPLGAGADENPGSDLDWTLPDDDGMPVSFNDQTNVDVLERIISFLARRPAWSVISVADGRKLGFKFSSSWRLARRRLIDAGLIVESDRHRNIRAAITPKGRRWLSEQRRASRKAG